MDTFTNIKIYIKIKDSNEPNLILKSIKGGLDVIKGKIKKVDPSCIFSAARIFVKKIYNRQDVRHYIYNHFYYSIGK